MFDSRIFRRMLGKQNNKPAKTIQTIETQKIKLEVTDKINDEVYRQVYEVFREAIKEDSPDQLKKEVQIIILLQTKQFKTRLFGLFIEKDNISSLDQIKQKAGVGSGGVCGKILKRTDIGYKCYDCQMDNTCIVCKDCFHNGDHSGHRYILQQQCAGCCDCGDPEAWKVQGFCSYHKGFKEYTYSQITDCLGVEFVLKTQKIIQAAIYFAVQICESVMIRALGKIELEDQTIFQRNPQLDQLFESLLYCLTSLVESTPMLQEILTLSVKATCNQTLLHECTNLTNHRLKKQISTCKCSFLDLIFRYNLILDSSVGKLIEEFFMSVFNVYSFKKCLQLSYAKNFRFLYIINLEKHRFEQYSKILDLEVQLFTSDELSYNYLITQNNYFEVFHSELKMLISSIIENPYESSQMIWHSIYKHIKDLCEKPLCLQFALSDKLVFEQLIDLSKMVHCFPFFKKGKTLFPDGEQFGLDLFIIQHQLLSQTEMIVQSATFSQIIMKCFPNHNLIIKDPLVSLLKMIVQQLDSLYSQSALQEDVQIFLTPVDRIFTQILVEIFSPLDEQLFEKNNLSIKLKLILESINVSEKDFKMILQRSIMNSLAGVSFMKSISYGQDQAYQCLPIYYSTPKYFEQSLDFLLFQIGFQLNNALDENFNFIPHYLSCYFQKQSLLKGDYKAIFNSPSGLKMLGEAVEILCYILTNEHVLMNNLLSVQNALETITQTIKQNNPFIGTLLSERNAKIQSKLLPILVNFVQQYKSQFNLNEVTSALHDQLLSGKMPFDKMLLVIADFDKTSKRFILKKDFQNQIVDPHQYYFHRNLQNDYMEQIFQKVQGQDKIILCNLGVRHEEKIKKPLYLKQLLDTVLTHQNLRKLNEIIEEFKIKKLQVIDQTTSSIFLAYLRLMNLAVSQKFNDQSQMLLSEVVTFLNLIPEVRNIQHKQEEITCCKDYLIEQIKKLTQMYKFSLSNITIEKMQVENIPEENQKRLSRKEQMMKKFEQKARDFENKNSNELDNVNVLTASQIMSISSGEIQQFKQAPNQPQVENICIFCRQILENKKLHGSLAYISLSNYQDYLKFWQGQSQIEKLAVNEDYQMIEKLHFEYQNEIRNRKDQCGHKIHLECLQNLKSKGRLRELEIQCPQCQGLSNLMLPDLVHFKPREKYLINEQVSIEHLPEYVQELHSMKQNNLDKSEQDMINEIFTRISIYFSFQSPIEERQLHQELQNYILQTVSTIVDIQEQSKNNQSIRIEIRQRKLSTLQIVYDLYYLSMTTSDHSNASDFFKSEVNYIENYAQLLKNEVVSNIEIELPEIFQQEEEKQQVKVQEQSQSIEVEIDEEYEDISEESDISSSQDFSIPLSSYQFQRVETQNLVPFEKIYHLNHNQLLNNDIDMQLSKIMLHSTLYQQSRILPLLLCQGLIIKALQIFVKIQLSSSKNDPFKKSYYQDNSFTLKSSEQQDYLSKVFTSSQYREHQIYLRQTLKKLILIKNLRNQQQLQNLDEKDLSKLLTELGLNSNLLLDFSGRDFSGKVAISYRYLQFFKKIKLSAKSFISLESNWQLMSKKYHNKKCKLCGDFPQGDGALNLCLLCGDQICSRSCQKQTKENVISIGNLNQHSKQHHEWTSIFLDLAQGIITIVKEGRNHLYDPIYFNQFGEEFKIKAKNWNEFNLDELKLLNLYKKLINEQLAQDILAQTIKSNVVYREEVF